jgi:hypothetical protein
VVPRLLDEIGISVDAPTLFTGEDIMVRFALCCYCEFDLMLNFFYTRLTFILIVVGIAMFLLFRFAKARSEPVSGRKCARNRMTTTKPKIL